VAFQDVEDKRPETGIFCPFTTFDQKQLARHRFAEKQALRER
jgi:hypothetical protein